MLALALALAAAPPVDALPDGDAYVRALVGRHRQREQLLDSYAYDLTEQREELDGRGAARSRQSRRYQVFHVRGRAVRTLVEEDGTPLSADRARRAADDARAQAEAIARGRVALEQPALQLSEVLDRCAFRTVAREDVDGRTALVLDFEPRGEAPRAGRGRLLHRLRGRVWIDEAEGQVVRARLRNTAPFRVAGGLGASVSSFAMDLEYRQVDGAVWLPLSRQTTVSGRKLLVKSFRVRSTSTYGGFRKFVVDAQEAVGKER